MTISSSRSSICVQVIDRSRYYSSYMSYPGCALCYSANQRRIVCFSNLWTSLMPALQVAGAVSTCLRRPKACVLGLHALRWHIRRCLIWKDSLEIPYVTATWYNIPRLFWCGRVIQPRRYVLQRCELSSLSPLVRSVGNILHGENVCEQLTGSTSPPVTIKRE